MDNVTWTSIRIRAQIDEKTRIDLRPIVRHNENVSNYLNTSIDLAVNRKFGKGWHGQFLMRKWFIPDNIDRVFLWMDLAHSINWDHLKANNRIRLHWALDTDGQMLSDFIRIEHSIKPNIKSRVTPLLSFETWLLLNDNAAIRRTRTVTGFDWQMTDKLHLIVSYRWENFIKNPNRRDENQYFTILTYNL